MKLEQLSKSETNITFILNEIRFVVSDTENLKLSKHGGRYKDFYHLGYHGMIAFVDKESGDALKAMLDES